MDKSYNKTPQQALDHFNTKIEIGLNDTQVEEQRKKYGPNELPHAPPTPLYKLIIAQFNDQLVMILLAAAFVSFVLAFFEDEDDVFSAFVEPVVILLILIANATVGVIQENNAEHAIEALKNYAPDEALVIRNGVQKKIKSEDLVPGDIVYLSIGDKIPADLRLLDIQSSALRVDQAILTGESISVSKETAPIKDTASVKQDQVNMLFSGTTVTFGHARAIVALTGLDTAIGEIQRNISSQEEQKTPLKKRLDDFGDSLAKWITLVCILVWIINIRHFNDPSHGGWIRGAVYYFKIAVALAVAAIPEGLAVIITTCLALGTKKMAKKNAIVRSLPSVETLGCTSVICSDKTGTLTTNRMSVSKFVIVQDDRGYLEEFSVSGTTFEPHGEIKSNHTNKTLNIEENPVVMELGVICTMCNDALVQYDPIHNNYTCIGEPTEAALKVLSEKMTTTDEKFNETLSELSRSDRVHAVHDYYESQFIKRATLDFDRDRKSMAVYCETKRQVGYWRPATQLLFVKGAPESILERSVSVRLSSIRTIPLDQTIRNKILEIVEYYGTKYALRILAVATSDNPISVSEMDLSSTSKFAEYEQNLTFVGLVAMSDPPRPEVSDSIRKCREAGINVVVITGDNQATAQSICRQIGIFDESSSSITGKEFYNMTAEEQRKIVKDTKLFSRTDPIHKSKLVDLFKKDGHIVAMTGDGVNDAPALKKADIGVAMGSGTDVAKLAADMVLADDNFATIVTAVEEGRAIYNNTKQFIRYLISSNIGEVVSIFLTVLLGMPEALIPVQLLWVNLVTDGLPATALGFNPPDHQVMKQSPRSPTEPIVTTWLFIRYCIIGSYVGAATVLGYAWWFVCYSNGPMISFYQLTHFHACSSLFPEIGCEMFTGIMARRATTMSLSILVTIEMFNAMNSLSENESLLTFPIWRNPFLVLAIGLSMILHFVILYIPFFSTLFEIVPLNLQEWQAVLLFSFPVIILDEGLKFISRNRMRNKRKQD